MMGIVQMLCTEFKGIECIAVTRYHTTGYRYVIFMLMRTENPCVGGSIPPLTTPSNCLNSARFCRIGAFFISPIAGRFPQISAYSRPNIVQILCTAVSSILQAGSEYNTALPHFATPACFFADSRSRHPP